jgi:hypothetical protein
MSPLLCEAEDWYPCQLTGSIEIYECAEPATHLGDGKACCERHAQYVVEPATPLLKGGQA